MNRSSAGFRGKSKFLPTMGSPPIPRAAKTVQDGADPSVIPASSLPVFRYSEKP